MRAEDLLALRPTAVQRHLGTDNATLLLSGLDVFEAAARSNTHICGVNVRRLELLPGIVRAAEELDVALEILAGAVDSADASYTGLEQICQVIAALVDAQRFSGPLVLTLAEYGAICKVPLEQITERLLFAVESGFTCFRFPTPQTAPELQDTVALMRIVAEHGLGIELSDIPEGGTAQVLELFLRAGIAPTTLDGQIAVAGGLVERRLAGRRNLNSRPFMSIVARALDVDDDEAEFAPIDPVAAERIEAIAYAQARLEMRRAQLVGSGSSCLAGLRSME